MAWALLNGPAMRSTFVSLALSLLVAGCAEETNRTDTELQTAPDPSATYRVVVGFESYGAGIDSEAYQNVVAYFSAYDIDVSPDQYAWGLEGETNLCFTLHGLNPSAQAIFVDEVGQIAQGSYLMNVYENVSCNLIGRN
jgi:hypothetical protein